MLVKVTMTDPKESNYIYEESIKTLRTNVQLTGKNIKTILCTSCYPNEGKSDIVFQLAVEMGKANKRVLILDADIRKSTFVKRYNVEENVNGLSQYLAGQVIKEAICYETNFKNVDIVFAGPMVPNPSELLEDKFFEEFVKEKRMIYDYILIDTPPMVGISDAVIIGKISDGAIIIIESEIVSYKVAQKVQQQLKKSGCRILGAVLNKVNIENNLYSSYYYNRYGKYYKEK